MVMAKMNYPATSHQEHKVQVSAKKNEDTYVRPEQNAQFKLHLDGSAGQQLFCGPLILIGHLQTFICHFHLQISVVKC